MSCDKFKELILDNLLEEPDANNNPELRKHINTCNACRLEYERIQSAVQALKPGKGEGLSLVEKLRLENNIYEARLKRLSGGNLGILWLKRLAAIAAALIFFFLGYSIRSLHQVSLPDRNMASAEKNIEELMNAPFSRISGQHISPQGLLLIAKGSKALQEYESMKPRP